MLVFVSDKGCFYCYTNTRSQSVPFKIMEEQFGDGKWLSKDGDSIIISTDGWYDVEWLKNLDGTYKAKLVGCLVHLRRYFYDIYGARQNHIGQRKRRISGFKTCGWAYRGSISPGQRVQYHRGSNETAEKWWFQAVFWRNREAYSKDITKSFLKVRPPKGYIRKNSSKQSSTLTISGKIHQNSGGRLYSSG